MKPGNPRIENIALRLNRRLGHVAGGTGISVLNQPRAGVNLLSYVPRVVIVRSHEGSGRYRVQEILEDGTELGNAPFDAYELNAATTVAVDTHGICIPVADGRTFVFFRPVDVLRFASVCMVDEANPAVNNFGVQVMANAHAGIPGAEQRIFAKFSRPLTVGGGTLIYLPMRIVCDWEVGDPMNNPSSAWCDFGVQCYYVTTDFDPTLLTWNNHTLENFTAVGCQPFWSAGCDNLFCGGGVQPILDLDNNWQCAPFPNVWGATVGDVYGIMLSLTDPPKPLPGRAIVTWGVVAGLAVFIIPNAAISTVTLDISAGCVLA